MFDEFQMGVLGILKVVPTQLLPNSWASIQAFRIVCKFLSLTPTPKVFLHLYKLTW